MGLSCVIRQTVVITWGCGLGDLDAHLAMTKDLADHYNQDESPHTTQRLLYRYLDAVREVYVFIAVTTSRRTSLRTIRETSHNTSEAKPAACDLKTCNFAIEQAS